MFSSDPNVVVFKPGRSPHPDPHSLLTRSELASALTSAGYRIAEKTLATRASRGDGPPYSVFNRRCLYRWDTSLRWAQESLRTPQTETAACTTIPAAGK
jgi:hypothetical protein